jgi:hypothetical protein
MHQATKSETASVLARYRNSSEYFAYFGFGSLVNRNTLTADVVDAIPVTLKGWRRHWQARPQESIKSSLLSKIALLNIHRDPSCEIDGLLIIDKLQNLSALDEREHAYDKITLSKSDIRLKNNSLNDFLDVSVQVYVCPFIENTGTSISILRSYLDVVMQGYYREYGKTGLGKFLNSTDGFELQINDDRISPVYPRHQQISDHETAIFENILINQYWRK